VLRRGKYLVVDLAAGGALVVHLRMTGNLLWTPAGVDPDADGDRFRRAEAELDDGSLLRYTDVRRLGTWLLLPSGVDAYLDAKLGPEPLSEAWTPTFLARALRGREAPVKALLLDQRIVAGLGNIYVDEALWRARVHPRTPGGRIRGLRAAAIHRAVREVLRQGIEAQGASIRDFRTPDGSYGSAQERFDVYGRAGEPCPRCGTPIERSVVGQRGTHACPRCQRAPRSLSPRTRARADRRAGPARAAR
jgi:formamidopyrimidine-DNA glycosylase